MADPKSNKLCWRRASQSTRAPSVGRTTPPAATSPDTDRLTGLWTLTMPKSATSVIRWANISRLRDDNSFFCCQMYVSMPALSMHILTHNLNHKCEVCGKAFSRPWLLQGHMRSHTGEKPYGCAHCGKKFADRSNLRAHMQTHNNSKTFNCTKCWKSFNVKSYLIKHSEQCQ